MRVARWKPSSLIEDQLHQSTYLALRGIHCESHEGMVILRGHLPTFYLKQIAQTVAGHVPGVLIVNRIEVGPGVPIEAEAGDH